MRLVLLHALPVDGRMWEGHLDLLPGRTHAPTLYRLGSTVGEWARQVLNDVPDDGQLVVVGASVGGFCALEVAAAAPDRVAALVLVGSKAGHRPQPAARDHALALLERGGMPAAWDELWAPLFSAHASATAIDRARAIALDQDPADVAVGVSAFHGRRDLTDVARRWPKSLVVVSGDEDHTPSPRTAAAVAEQAPRGEFHLVARCGHYVALEQPDALASILADVLSRAD